MQKITLSKTQQTLLTTTTHASTSPQRLVLRAGIILAYAEAPNQLAIARDMGIDRNTVYLWLTRWQDTMAELNRLEIEFATQRLSETIYRRALSLILGDAPRPGHHATFTEEQKRQIIALASETPEQAGVPITHWTHVTLRNAVIDKGIVPTISRAHVGRFLKQSHAQTPQE